MSDIMQFTPELLEGRSLDTCIRGTVIHVLKLETPDPTDPPVYLLKHLTGEAEYSCVCIGAKEQPDFQMGDEVLLHKIEPGVPGSPTFLFCSPAPARTPDAVNGDTDPAKIPPEELPAKQKEMMEEEVRLAVEEKFNATAKDEKRMPM